MIELEQHDCYAVLRLNNPAKRNALSVPMFDAIDEALATIERDEQMRAILLVGNGSAFCAGFDLPAAQQEPELLAVFIRRLSALTRQLRRMEQVVVASVHGAAIAGGCAIVSACDFVITTPDSRFGYPVHQLGISPAVTIPTLQQRIGESAARALLIEGEHISGERAHAIGLATHLAQSEESLQSEADALVCKVSAKPPYALKVTKHWLNELDGSLDDTPFNCTATASAALASGEEATAMLTRFLHFRRAKIE